MNRTFFNPWATPREPVPDDRDVCEDWHTPDRQWTQVNTVVHRHERTVAPETNKTTIILNYNVTIYILYGLYTMFVLYERNSSRHNYVSWTGDFLSYLLFIGRRMSVNQFTELEDSAEFSSIEVDKEADSFHPTPNHNLFLVDIRHFNGVFNQIEW